MTREQLQDKCRGSLVGGAVGDALGYEVEFMNLAAIRKRFGKKGITCYVLHDGVAQFSDDTQMTLFTLEGLMSGVMTRKRESWRQFYRILRKAISTGIRPRPEYPNHRLTVG